MATLIDFLSPRESAPEIADEIGDENVPEIPAEPSVWADIDPDPAPAAPRKSGGLSLPEVAVARVTPALKNRIAGEIEAYIEMAAIPLVMRDPVCGGALHEQAKPMAKAIAQILSRYPELASKFMATGVFGDWIKLVMVTAPVLRVVYSHHSGPQETPHDHNADLPDDFDPFRPGS